jgi:hypothetical protein
MALRQRVSQHSATTPRDILTCSTGPGSLIFARQNPGCITGCPALPACQCNDNQRCELTAQTCGACAEVKCVDIVRPKEKFSGGAIAGACLGGLVGATIFSFVVWKLCGKKRKRSSLGASAAEKENDFGMLKSARVCLFRGIPAYGGAVLTKKKGFNPHGRIYRLYCPHSCFQRYPDRIYSRSNESLESQLTRPPRTSRAPDYLCRLTYRLTVPSNPAH